MKTFAMLLALAAVLAAGSACFTPSSRPDPHSPLVRANSAAGTGSSPDASR